MSQPGKLFEREADQVADQVMRMAKPTAVGNGREGEARGERNRQPRSADLSARLPINHHPSSTLPLAPPIVNEVLHSPGRPLDETTRAFMEPRFGRDFSRVRVHTDAKAAESARVTNALAFTVGENVVFGVGQYALGTTVGQRLLAHELTHTLQRKGDIQRNTQRQHSDENGDAPPFESKSLQQKLEDLKTFTNDNDPQAQYRAAREILIASYANQILLSPTDEQFLIAIVAKQRETPNRQQNVSDHNVISSKYNAAEGSVDPDVQEMLEGKLQQIKCGEYTSNPQAGYDTARELLIANLMQRFALSPQDNQLLVAIVAGGKTPLSQENIIAQGVAVETDCHPKEVYTAGDVERAAWDIVQHEQSVKDAFLFYSQIKTNVDELEWEKELANFFIGKFEPRTRIKPLDNTGETPPRPGPLKHKRILLNVGNSFSVAVSTYLHEMTHYVDMWYSSLAADMRGKDRPGVEWGTGIAPIDKGDLSEKEQVSALGESLTATIEQILRDMQNSDPQPNEHRLVPRERLLYEEARKKKGFRHDDYLNERGEFIKNEAAGPSGTYAAWGSSVEQGKITATGLELGFAFEKAAYGFYNSKKEGEWAVGFYKKFQKKYCKYLR